MWSPPRNRPSVCLSCSHYSHLARQSSLFPLSLEQLKHISVVRVCLTLGQPDTTLGLHPCWGSCRRVPAAFTPDPTLRRMQAGLRSIIKQPSPVVHCVALVSDAKTCDWQPQRYTNGSNIKLSRAQLQVSDKRVVKVVARCVDDCSSQATRG